jgi:hypothetical protein
MRVIHRVPDKRTTRSRQVHDSFTTSSRQVHDKIVAGGSASILSATRSRLVDDSFTTDFYSRLVRNRFTTGSRQDQTNIFDLVVNLSQTSREVGSVASDLANLNLSIVMTVAPVVSQSEAESVTMHCGNYANW